MMTVHEVSKLTGVSVRTLQYYDNIGLLKPTEYTESRYRLYDDVALGKLQQILLFRELEFSLKEIKEMMESPNFDQTKALEQQIELLTLKKEHLENLITFAIGIKMLGVRNMDFNAFDTTKIDEYAKRAKEQWGNGEVYKEFEEKSAGWTQLDEMNMANDFMGIFEEFGKLKEQPTDSQEVRSMVKKLQYYISEHFYKCTDEILKALGKMYSGGGEFTNNIDAVGGEGTAVFVDNAISDYLK